MIGRDGKQLIVRNGGMVIRVHVCRLVKVPHDESKINKSVEKRNSPVLCERQTAISQEIVYDCEEDNTKVVGMDNMNAVISDAEQDKNEVRTNCDPVQHEEPSATNENVVYKAGQRVRGICAHSG